MSTNAAASLQEVTILGATGSVGRSTLAVIENNPDRYAVFAMTAYANVDGMYALCCRFRPAVVVMVDSNAASKLKARLQHANSRSKITVLSGENALSEVASAPEVSIVVAAIVGAAGLLPTMAAVTASKRVLLANKEVLVMTGSLFMEAVSRHGAQLLPVDSEHNAILQALPTHYLPGQPLPTTVQHLILTASGGPFRDQPLSELPNMTPQQALAHPTWNMGAKISIDSATMMNKGLELIEACWLFDADIEQIEIVIHPQSIIHSLVRYQDGSVLAQCALPDMRVPIAAALAWPDRICSGAEALNLLQHTCLEFYPICLSRYPCLALADQAMRQGGSAPTILNAVNEIAVDAFLKKSIRFDQISQVIAHVLHCLPTHSVTEIEEVLAVDIKAREYAQQYLSKL